MAEPTHIGVILKELLKNIEEMKLDKEKEIETDKENNPHTT